MSYYKQDDRLILPDFLGIGAQKSATGWLYTMLQLHPEIYLPQKKEVHFFDLNYINGLEWYSNHFLYAGNKKTGEITPSYSILSSDAIDYIYKIMPSVRLVLLLRNPIDRAWSQALMELVTVKKRNYDDVSRSEFISHFEDEGSLIRGDYKRILDKWLKVFPKEQLLVQFYEEVVNSPKDLVVRVLDHIKVSPDKLDWTSVPLSKKVFEEISVEIPLKYKKHLQNLYKVKMEEWYKKYKYNQVGIWLEEF